MLPWQPGFLNSYIILYLNFVRKKYVLYYYSKRKAPGPFPRLNKNYFSGWNTLYFDRHDMGKAYRIQNYQG